MNFANRLKQLRKENNLTQEELAQKISKTRSTIAGYETERKEPDYETLVLLAKYFNVSLDYLMGVSDVRNPYINDKDLDEVNKFLLELKKEAEKEGLEFDETSPQELIETYKLLKEFKKRTKGD